MSKWQKICKEFAAVRKTIDDNGDLNLIKQQLISICDKYAKQNWDFAEDYAELAEELTDADIDTDDEMDYYLSEFYNLCDNARVWLEV